MNDTALDPTRLGPSYLTLTEVKQNPDPAKDIEELKAMREKAGTAGEAATQELLACQEQAAEYRRMGLAMNDVITKKSAEFAKFREDAIMERFNNFDAVDVPGLSQQLRTRLDDLKFEQDSYVRLMEVLMQNSQEHTKEATLKLRTIEALVALIDAALSEAENQLALGPLYGTNGRISFVSERTEVLRSIANAASKAETQARVDLADFRARRAKMAQQTGNTF